MQHSVILMHVFEGTRLSFFEAEDMEVISGVASEDQLESVRKSTAKRTAVAGEGGKDFFGFELPHLQRPVL